MLTVSDLTVQIASATILEGVSLRVEPGSLTALIGRNGAGKTTFMRSVMGLIPIRRGGIDYDGRDLAADPAHRRAGLGIGYMPEDRRLVPELTVRENIMVPAWATRLEGAQAPPSLFDGDGPILTKPIEALGVSRISIGHHKHATTRWVHTHAKALQAVVPSIIGRIYKFDFAWIGLAWAFFRQFHVGLYRSTGPGRPAEEPLQ